MRRFLVLLCLVPCILPLTALAEEVRVPGPDGILLNAELFLPKGVPHGAPVLELHSCAGPNAQRDAEWARRLAADGHVVLLPDSYGSRGLTSQCTHPTRGVTSSGMRQQDTLAAARWLAARPGTAPGGVVLLGWSDGATTALATVTAAPDLTPGLFRGVVAFYPGCSGFADRANWSPAAPMLILVGDSDQRNPVAPCRILAERLARRIELVTYPGAVHDFDMMSKPPTQRPHRGPAIAEPISPNEAAREDAARRVPAFIAQIP